MEKNIINKYFPNSENITNEDVFYIENEKQNNRITMWTVFAGFISYLRKITATESGIGFMLPLVLIITGVGIISFPSIQGFIENIRIENNYYTTGNVAAVSSEAYIQPNGGYISNPGTNYFEDLFANALSTGYIFDEESSKYNGTIYITIPSLGIKELPIQANVESSVGSAYNQVLTTKLAHFKGSSLPHVSSPGNIVIYGHSVGGAYIPQANDVVSAFTFLPNLSIGDEVILKEGGEEYTYRISSGDIVSPQETQIITGTPGRESLTLFTCWPPGNNNNRYVVKARPV